MSNAFVHKQPHCLCLRLYSVSEHVDLPVTVHSLRNTTRLARIKGKVNQSIMYSSRHIAVSDRRTNRHNILQTGKLSQRILHPVVHLLSSFRSKLVVYFLFLLSVSFKGLALYFNVITNLLRPLLLLVHALELFSFKVTTSLRSLLRNSLTRRDVAIQSIVIASLILSYLKLRLISRRSFICTLLLFSNHVTHVLVSSNPVTTNLIVQSSSLLKSNVLLKSTVLL